jgi:Putative MetA-pathway of phenol degradation
MAAVRLCERKPLREIYGRSSLIDINFDVLADADGAGHHGALINLVNVAHPLGSKMTVAFEVWDSVNRDPAGTDRQRSADVALTYLVRPALQLDVGANVGLNHATPDRQIYLGFSTRF